MAAIISTSNMMMRRVSPVSPFLRTGGSIAPAISLKSGVTFRFRIFRFCGITSGGFQCKASESGEKKVSSRMSLMNKILQEAEERAVSAGNEPAPKITLDQVTVSFARSGGPGGQNVNKVNTKVDMRFNIKNANWLSERIKEKIMQMEKNRINKDGEIVISSTRTRTQKGNIEDALEKLQAIIDAASYVPPPPSEEQKKRISKLAAIGEQKRLHNKKALSQKKAIRRNRDSWD